MSGLDRVYFGNHSDKFVTSSIRAQGLVDCPLISSGIRIGTSGTTDAVEIPPLAIVTKVGLWNTGTAIASASLSVGVSTVIDKFIDDASTIAANDIIFSGLAGTVDADPVAGAYFADGGVIQLIVKATGTDNSTVKVLVWYTGTS